MSRARPLTFYEFFAGGGMARIGLGPDWRCAFANDFDPVKAAVYRANFADAEAHFREGDVWALSPEDLPGQADLAWASSPCQDFSLAGGRAGLKGGRSSAFFGFWRLIEALNADGRAPRAVVIENVTGLFTSHGGADFTALCEALAREGYRFGALEIDASRFLPQSRPRAFVVAVREAPAAGLAGDSVFHTRLVREAHGRLPAALAERWVWWRAEAPPRPNADLSSLIEADAPWRDAGETDEILGLMSPLHRQRLEALRASGARAVGALFRRMRVEDGVRVQRAEARFDGLAGCLRTPRGGSSRQTLIMVEDGEVRTRLITAREGARLMGLPDGYALPHSANRGLHVVGDGVAVPVVRWLAAQLLEPHLSGRPGVLAAE
ncbi:DNA cytosine methyltransferase [Phenylobacterium sp.]|uniref:DNA cytosine methyltransferase n=1 Tax=Phenylobacterium sp. TaxID=1871053 RepID=UPI0035AFD70E